MNGTKIYMLKSEQLDFYEKFKKVGFNNAGMIFKKIVDFITFMHETTGMSTAVVGSSGGIDSSFVLSAAVEALGVENVKMVMLPYEGIKSSMGGIQYSRLLGDYLGIPEDNRITIPIFASVNIASNSIMRAGLSLPNQKQLGNLMARVRMMKLYHIADEYKGLVLDTCNNTEIKMGYLTKHGDGASDYNPVGDVYKVWIWEITRRLKLVPNEIIERTPSADLIEGQSDVCDMGISYEALDPLLCMYFDFGVSKEDLMKDYHYPKEIIDMVMEKVEINKHKSIPTPICSIIGGLSAELIDSMNLKII